MGWICSSQRRNKKFTQQFDIQHLLKSNNLEEKSNMILEKETARKVERLCTMPNDKLWY